MRNDNEFDVLIERKKAEYEHRKKQRRKINLLVTPLVTVLLVVAILALEPIFGQKGPYNGQEDEMQIELVLSESQSDAQSLSVADLQRTWDFLRTIDAGSSMDTATDESTFEVAYTFTATLPYAVYEYRFTYAGYASINGGEWFKLSAEQKQTLAEIIADCIEAEK
ncbi:MAG: hypothetical protein PHX51_06115 [Clostridia bacterium]|nr:hypothetical protein [Clostridia bacterium]